MLLSTLVRPMGGGSQVQKSGDPVASSGESDSASWQLLGALGLALSIVGAIDVGLAWYPLAFNAPEWEFGTITATFDGLPVLTMGLCLVFAGALHGGSRRARVVLRAIFGVLGVSLIAAGLLYASVMPLALRALSDPAVEVGLYRAMVKTVAQAITYPTLCLWIAFRRWS